MPSPSLADAFDAARERHTAAIADLLPLLIEMALATVADVLPGAEVLETEGEMNEDWLFTLRIHGALDGSGNILYDIGRGHDDPVVEETINRVGFEYLDLLLDLTGGDYLGIKPISRRSRLRHSTRRFRNEHANALFNQPTLRYQITQQAVGAR